ncbi:MAG: NAD(P)-binding domain-containing protein [Saprospiraceae bacterium]
MNTLDYLVIGAGPAGLQLGYYLEEKSESSYVVLERAASAGSFFQKYPRRRTLISINKVHIGSDDPELKMRWDWNSLISDDTTMRMGKYSQDYFPSADYLVKYLQDFAEQFKLKINYNSEVVSINKKDGLFIVKTINGDTYQAKVVVVGTGTFKPNTPDIPGIEHCENYIDYSVEKSRYNNKRVLVLGKGNSGFETADELISSAATIHIASPSPIKFAWQTHFVGHLRALNNNFLDTYQLKSQNAVLDATVEKVEKRDGKLYVTFNYSHANNEVEEIMYDHVIVATGFKFDDSIFGEECKPALAINDRFPDQTSAWGSTNVDDLYFIGALTQMRDWKKHTSAFIHGFRYNAACLFNIMHDKYQNVEIPSEEVAFTVRNLTDRLMEGINRSSCLWQQFGFICDLLTVNPAKGTAAYTESVPTAYVHDSKIWMDDHQFILTLEYGDTTGVDVFNANRIARDEVMEAKESQFLHPIVRHYYKGEMISEHHMIEVLEARWTDEKMHIQPLYDYLEKELAMVGKKVTMEEATTSM